MSPWLLHGLDLLTALQLGSDKEQLKGERLGSFPETHVQASSLLLSLLLEVSVVSLLLHLIGVN